MIRVSFGRMFDEDADLLFSVWCNVTWRLANVGYDALEPVMGRPKSAQEADELEALLKACGQWVPAAARASAHW